jgi:hypothetical protein
MSNAIPPYIPGPNNEIIVNPYFPPIDIPSSGGGAAPVVPFNLGAVSGDVTLDGTEEYQYGYLTGNLDIVGISGGAIGDTVVFEIQWATGTYTLDMSGIKLDAGAALLPVTLEAYRTYILAFKFLGGGWSLTDIRGPYTETVDQA